MKVKLVRLPQFVLPSVLVIVFCTAVASVLFIPRRYHAEGGWKGYYTLVVAGDDRSAVDRLAHVGISGVISESTSFVTFNDFSAFDRVSVRKIPDRFDPVDPRLDPYMRAVDDLFRTRIDGRLFHLLYIPADGVENPSRGTGTPRITFPLFQTFRLRALVKRAVDPLHVTWFLPEWNGPRRALFGISFLIFAGILVLRTRRYRVLVLLGALPWLSGPIAGGYGAFAASCVFFFAWAYLFEELSSAIERQIEEKGPRRQWLTRRVIIRLMFYAGTLLVGPVLLFDGSIGLSSLAPLVTGVVGTGALVGLSVKYITYRHRHHEHRTFMPVRILRPTLARAIRGVYTTMVPVLLIIVMLPPVLLLIVPAGESALLPRPVSMVGVGGLSWGAVQRLWRKDRDGLPDLASYVAHRAFQDAFLYNHSYSFPKPGEEVKMSRFSWHDGRISEHQQAMVTFSAKWYRHQLDIAQGIARLLVSQGRPVRVVRESVRTSYTNSSTLIRHTSIVLVLFLPFLVSLIRLSMQMRYGLRDTIVRKRRLLT